MQGFNMGRYYPPDADRAPAFNQGSHPLGQRAKKINQGVLTVRFELPFAVWCTTCKPEAIVGQGVRFNAEKKRVGNYHSTPIWSFRMKHTACGGWWEIRTDPQNAEYVVVEGARRRDYGPDEVGKGEGEMAFLTEEEREKRRLDAFANLEGKMEEKSTEKKNKERVEELYEQSMVWEDPYTANQKLRAHFRVGRKAREKEEKVKEGMQDKFSFGYDIADETETDRVRAGLVEFKSDVTAASGNWKPLFESKAVESAGESKPKQKKLKSEILADQSRQQLQKSLVGNTKAALDPFLSDSTRPSSKTSLGLLKRKRDHNSQSESSSKGSPAAEPSLSTSAVQQTPVRKTPLSVALVDYESD